MLHHTCLFAVPLLWFLCQASCEEECTTPNNEKAKCMPINSCPILRLIVETSRSEPAFLLNSTCSSNKTNDTICCASSSNPTQPEKQQQAFPKLSRYKRYCGKQHSDDYFHTASGTLINEFPWLAAFAYVDESDSEHTVRFKCGGSLISQRYVLTAAQCFILNWTKVVFVRVGEYHLNNDTDCIEDNSMYECSDPAEDIGVEKIIMHPEYDRIKKVNDIALVKLNRSIYYSDYIRPICLPLPDAVTANVGDTVITSGWGTEAHFLEVNIKTKTYSKLISGDECRRAYKGRRRPIRIEENRFCTLHLNNNTEVLCTGDAGGPVMFSRQNRVYQEGIISAGPTTCSRFPLIHTNVVHFLDWIEDNID